MAGFSDYDALISSINSGRKINSYWNKGLTTFQSANNWYNLFNVTGQPGAGTWDTTPSGCVPLSGTVTGSYYAGPNVSPKTKHLINGHVNQSAAHGLTIMLVDQVAYYPINQSTSNQTFVNTNLPTRYISNGDPGLQVCLVATAATGATSSNLTELGYVNQNGTSGQIDTSSAIAVTVSATAPTTNVGARVLTTTAGPFLPLGAGDTGVRRLTYCTFSAANTGLHAFLLVKPLAYFPLCSTIGAPTQMDYLMQLTSLERIYDNSCLGFMLYTITTTAVNLWGSFDMAWN